ncbi:MAG: alkaline phosphatase D family protein, partial [Microthrixaceae bacterium]
ADNDLPECTTLAEYRRRYAVYRGDGNLRAAHAAAPWLVVWDDHEVDNNYAGLTSEKDGVAPEEFTQRRTAAYRAWWENMPVRLPAPEGPDLEIDRQIEWGSLASFFLIDTRQFRADQACGDATLDLGPACDEVNGPDRQFLGAAQEARLIEGLTTSESTWNVIGNQTVMSPLVVGDAILNYDQWDGYPEARERLLSTIEGAGLTNTVVITGDIHVAGVGDVQLGEGDDARTVATELVGTSISSGAPIPEDLSDLVSTLLPWIQYFDARRGWTRCSVSSEEWAAEYRVVNDNLAQDQPVEVDATFTIKPDSPGAMRA